MFGIIKILLFLSHFILIKGEGITCYQCSPTRENQGRGILPCSEFDGSAKFDVECPKSTFCYKRTYTIPLGHEKIVSVERGCTLQKEETHQYNREERKYYKKETIVESAYEEGCSIAEDNGRPGHPTEYCYCSYWLCNKSKSLHEINFYLIMLNTIGILLYMWHKY